MSALYASCTCGASVCSRNTLVATPISCGGGSHAACVSAAEGQEDGIEVDEEIGFSTCLEVQRIGWG
jgi:hypothetical protein